MQLGGASLKGEPKQIQLKRNIHPTVKPIKLFEYLIKLCTTKDSIVLDPFLGSGTTMLVACENKRSCIGYEIDPSLRPIIEAKVSPNAVAGNLTEFLSR